MSFRHALVLRYWVRAIAAFALILSAALFVSCTADHESETDLAAPRIVPLTNFHTPTRRIELELDCPNLSADLLVNESQRIDLPARQLPIKTLDLPDGRLFIVARHLFSGDLSMWSVNPDGSRIDIAIPDRLRYSVFRQAAVYRTHVMVILYNVVTKRNFLYRMLADGSDGFEFDENFLYEVSFDGRYEIATNVHVGVYNDALYICGEGTRFIYDEREKRPNRNRFAWSQKPEPRQLTLLEMIAGDSGIYGLYQDHERAKNDGENAGANPFFIYNLDSLQYVELLEGGDAPYDLRFENGRPTVSRLSGPEQLIDVIRIDLANAEGCGTMNLGMNNFEGRVAWSQVYYLNGLINLLVDWDAVGLDFDALQGLRAEAKARLDIEMFLLDRMLDEGEPGIVSKRYSIERPPGTRAPAVFAVQSGRILRLFKRYLDEVPGPIALRNFNKLKAMTESLDNHEEQLVVADDDDPWVEPGRMYLKWPKGRVFPFDGVGIPFNHQDDWAGGVAYGCTQADRDQRPLQAARDIASLLIEKEALQTDPPADFKWHYWWGQAREGWTAADGVSENRPSYPGDSSYADISYLTIDAMAVLSVGRVFPEILTPELIDYFKRAVEAEGLWLICCEELLQHGVEPTISRGLAYRYFRMSDVGQLQNAVWAYAVIENDLRH